MREKIDLGEYIVHIIDDPLKNLSEEEKNKFAKSCVPVARRGFGSDGITLSDIFIHAMDVSTGIYVEDKKGEIVAFGGSVVEKINDSTVLHLKGTAVLPEHQGKGLYNIITPLRVLREAEKNDSNLYVGSRTQNPRVVEYMTQILGFHPQIGTETPENIVDLAEGYAQRVLEKHSDFIPAKGLTFDRKNLIMKRAYGSVDAEGNESGFCMYGTKENLPTARNQGINDFVQEKLDVEDGDTIILLGELDKQTYVSSLEKVTTMLDENRQMIKRFE